MRQGLPETGGGQVAGQAAPSRVLQPRNLREGGAGVFRRMVTSGSGTQRAIPRPAETERGERWPAPHLYLARLNTYWISPPVNGTGLLYFSSSAVTETIVRLWPLARWFGNELASTFRVKLLSASLTVYVPK
jgi:hypothetical protein